MKKKNLDFEISLLKWNIQFRIIWTKYRHVEFCDFRYRSCSQY